MIVGMINKIANTVRGPGESELYGGQNNPDLDSILIQSFDSSLTRIQVPRTNCLSIACVDFHFHSPASLISGVGDLQ